jgi:hypothetical protein
MMAATPGGRCGASAGLGVVVLVQRLVLDIETRPDGGVQALGDGAGRSLDGQEEHQLAGQVAPTQVNRLALAVDQVRLAEEVKGWQSGLGAMRPVR